MTGFVVFPFALVFLPWQQNIRGEGRVVAFDPFDRAMRIEAPIEGRIKHCYVKENDFVRAGDVIVDITDNDPEVLKRLQDQLTEAKNRLDASQNQLTILGTIVAFQTEAMNAALRSIDDRISVAASNINIAEDNRNAAEAQYENQKLRLARVLELAKEGLESPQVVENTKRDHDVAKNTLERDTQVVERERKAYDALVNDRQRVLNDEQSRIRATENQIESARGAIAAARQDVLRLETQINRQATMEVKAPRDGTVIRLLVTDGSFLKAQSPVAILVPESDRRLVELWVRGNDVPLIQPGRAVRLQFEGWPALQFSGWPSVAIGTFGGAVYRVDKTDDGKGRFRVLVEPNPDVRKDGSRIEWPGNEWLRQGSKAKGWVLLDTVSLGYEVWRQLNGFPPTVAIQEPEKTDDPAK